jgi:hypothetical protein
LPLNSVAMAASSHYRIAVSSTIARRLHPLRIA